MNFGEPIRVSSEEGYIWFEIIFLKDDLQFQYNNCTVWSTIESLIYSF